MFGTLEGVITSLHDLKLFPWLRKEILTGMRLHSTQIEAIICSDPL